MTTPLYLQRSKQIYDPEHFKIVNTTQTSTPLYSAGSIDVAFVHKLIVMVNWSMSVLWDEGGGVYLDGLVEEQESPAFDVRIPPTRYYGTGVINPDGANGVILDHTLSNGKVMLVYEDLPKWVNVGHSLAGGSREGTLRCAIYGWMH